MDQSLRTRWHSSVSCLINELLLLHSYSLGCESQTNALDAVSQRWLEKVSELYAQPHRAYHNMTHIQDVIASLDFLLEREGPASLVDTKPNNEEAILVLASFFHDVIYNPKSSTNEKDSADLFLQFVSELLAAISSSQTTQQQENSTSSVDGSPEEQSCKSCNIVMRTEECIIATATHVASAAKAHETQNHTLAIFLDADMSILGKDSAAYNNYAGCIRREYEFVERNVYCEKRADILESFLPRMDKTTEGESNSSVPAVAKKHSYIYATQKGRQRWEEQARRNMKNEIEMLRRKVIPCEEQK